jgi:hypothetical protein
VNRIRLLLPLAAAAVLAAVASSASGAASSGIVLGQVYAAGGNTGAVYANDYVELFNRGSGSVDLAGWTLQYATADGTTWQPTALAGTVPAGGHYLVQLASGGSNGGPLPAPDASGTSNLAMSGGKLAVVRAAAALTCGSSPGSCSADPNVEDFLGYGGATDYEGSAPAPAPSATTALVRAAAGCTDSGDSGADFALGTPVPENSTAPPAPCAGEPPQGVSADASVDVDLQPLLSISLDQTGLSFPSAVPGSIPTPLPEKVTVGSNDPSGYLLTVHRNAFSPQDLPLGIGVGGGSLAPVPVAPQPDLTLASTTGPSGGNGDAWATSVGFVSALPILPAGHYTATLTFTVIGR